MSTRHTARRACAALLLLPILAAYGHAQSPARAPNAAKPASSNARAASVAAATLPLKRAPRPTTPAITEADLMTRLYIFADDSMLGREAGTQGNVKGTAYIAREAKRLGLRPAGEKGGWFQDVPMVRRVFNSSTLTVNGRPLALWSDVAIVPGRGTIKPVANAPVVYGGVLGDATRQLPIDQMDGKVVVFSAGSAPSLRAGQPLTRAAAIIIARLDSVSPATVQGYQRASLTLSASAYDETMRLPMVAYVTGAAAERIFGAPLSTLALGASGRPLQGAIGFGETAAPARNVVAILPGSDPKLRGEYVALGAHNDHIGVRAAGALDHDSLKAYNAAARRVWLTLDTDGDDVLTNAQQAEYDSRRAGIHVNVDSLRRHRPARPDSINNGADDDGTGSIALLEIAELYSNAKTKPKRSLLFVWHTGEEKGLVGSRWYADHPTVSRDSIVAQLNIDMIGRGGAEDELHGGPDYVGVIGARRLSTELGDLADRVNGESARPLVFDRVLDADGHSQNIYCRSDHYNYARYGIPIIFFFSGLHGDYHQLTDEPQYIDYPHYLRIAQYVGKLAGRVADLSARPVVDKPKPDPNGVCRQ